MRMITEFPKWLKRVIGRQLVKGNALYSFIVKIKNGINRRLRKFKDIYKLSKSYNMHRHDDWAIEKATYRNEYIKFKKLLLKYGHDTDLWEEINYFYETDLRLCYDSMTKDIDPKDPIVIVVVKNEIERIKLFYNHYRKIGVTHFIIIDNNSTDGTFEWACKQNRTRVFSVIEEFSTNKKMAWIQRVLSMTGYDRWYLVMDSDELLDYIGSEKHGIKECISYAEANHFSRLNGLMIDMYSSREMFSEECTCDNIERTMCYFDAESYVKRIRAISPLYCGYYFTGGPRERVLNSKTKLSKQCLFFFSKDSMYFNAHFLLPVIDWTKESCCFALRHYKFLKSDVEEYRLRTIQQGFAFNSRFYKDMFDENGNPIMANFMYEGSIMYEDSTSLRALSYIKEIQW